MKPAFKLRLQHFLFSNSSGLGWKHLKVGALVCVKPRKYSNSTGPPAKCRISMDIHTDAKNKGVAMEIAGNDSVEKMTVQQLRSKLRGLGVPAKGCKQDLISALKSFQDQEVNGEDSLEVVKQILPKDKSICAKNNSKRKSNKTSSVLDQIENISTGSEILEKKRMKTNVNEAKGEDSETTLFTIKQELSAKIDEVTGLNSNRTEKKTESKISSTYCGTLDWVDVCERQKGTWTVLTHKKPNKEWVPYNPESMRPLPLTADTKHLKLMSWNVNGIRALLKLEGFSALQLAKREDFDVLCLQETKIQEKDVEEIKRTLLEGYENSFWTCSVSKLGYSGTAIISRIKPISVSYGLGISDHDREGRLITMEFDSFYLLCGYVPNSGDGLRRLSYRVTQWDTRLSSHMKELEKVKPVILTGDLNCAHQEIDIYNPAGNKRSAGFTIEERQSFTANYLNNGFVDTFRKQHPNVVGYTYWGYRHGGRKTNKGWRLDYFLVSESIADKVHDSYILPDVTGSDHCPIGLVVKL